MQWCPAMLEPATCESQVWCPTDNTTASSVTCKVAIFIANEMMLKMLAVFVLNTIISICLMRSTCSLWRHGFTGYSHQHAASSSKWSPTDGSHTQQQTSVAWSARVSLHYVIWVNVCARCWAIWCAFECTWTVTPPLLGLNFTDEMCTIIQQTRLFLKNCNCLDCCI